MREQVAPKSSRGGAIPVELQVLATLLYLGSNSFQMLCGDMLGMDHSTVSRCVKRVTTALRDIAGNFIYFVPHAQVIILDSNNILYN